MFGIDPRISALWRTDDFIGLVHKALAPSGGGELARRSEARSAVRRFGLLNARFYSRVIGSSIMAVLLTPSAS
jgi:hypothetical protein